MRLERVLQMTVDELVVRGRQEASKWLERMASGKTPLPAAERVKRRTGGVRRWLSRDSQRTAIAPLDHIREHILQHFFEGAARVAATARLIERVPENRERIMRAADAICRGRFDLLGYGGLDFGNPVDWHLDPISGRRAPLVHWSRLVPPDPAAVGDIKVVWELNRHQWLLHLGQAYQFTGDERYAEAFARYVREWMQANPPSMGINWASSLEVAFRLISWCWALVLFGGSRALTTRLLTEMIAGIGAHASHVERYLSLYSSPNTHLTGEALGLFYAGVLFPAFARAEQWRARGAEILVGQCERHILPDGVYFEQSTYYQRYTADIYLHFLILTARNGIRVARAVAKRVERSLDFLMAVRRPDGSMPHIGDVDGGWTLPLVPRTPDDLRGTFSIAAALFGRSDYAWVAGGLAPETLWLLGSRGAQAFDALTSAPPQTAPSQIFPQGGYVVMRGGWEPDAHQLIFDVGPIGSPLGAHGHADLLSIQCSVFGKPFLVDPGMYCYAVHPEWRNFFRSTEAHSTVEVDGHAQAVPAGPFKWQALPEARLRRWLSTEVFDFADAEHNGYARLADPVIHRRRVLFMKPRYWMIVDDVTGTAEHKVNVHFQLAPLEVTVDRNLWARACGSERGILIRSFASVPLTATIRTSAVAPIRGWVSPNYGLRRPAPLLTYATDARPPLRIVTVLVPLTDPKAPPPPVSLSVEDERGAVHLRFLNSGETVRLDEDGPVICRDTKILQVTGSGF